MKALVICAISAPLLFLSFFTDSLRVADRQWFDSHLLDMASFIVGRMVRSSQDGILSAGGLPGLGSLSRIPVRYADTPFYDQYRAYIEHLPFGAYTPYKSQIGAQGMLFSVLDRAVALTPQKKLKLFRGLTSALSAIALTVIILWFYVEFGTTVALFVLASALLSQWLVIFGRNLWWSLWAFFVPVVAVMYYLRSSDGLARVRMVRLRAMAFVAVLVKCLFNGYEYSTTTLIMMIVPLVYYGILQRVTIRKLLSVSLVTAIGSGLAVLLSLVVLCFQIAQVDGSLRAGVDHIIYSLEKRSHATPEYFPSKLAPSLEATTASVVTTYLSGTFLDVGSFRSGPQRPLNHDSVRVRYWHLLVLFAVMTAVLIFLRRRGRHDQGGRNHVALIVAAWFSVLAPLSWFVVFKAHSHIHTRINYIVWQMPFVLFGFAICGAVAGSLLKQITRLSRRSMLSDDHKHRTGGIWKHCIRRNRTRAGLRRAPPGP